MIATETQRNLLPDFMDKTIYRPLVGEGRECRRPVHTMQIDSHTFEAVDNPENESWGLAPFSRVRCRDKVFAGGQVGPVALAYAIESHPCYRLLTDHRGQVMRIVLADGEEAIARVIYVDKEHENFFYDLLSANLACKYRSMPREAAYAKKFSDSVAAAEE